MLEILPCTLPLLKKNLTWATELLVNCKITPDHAKRILENLASSYKEVYEGRPFQLEFPFVENLTNKHQCGCDCDWD